MTNGTSQHDRISPALEEGYFRVDEMSFEVLLAKAADYARVLRHYDLNNEPNGDWESFFSSDEAVVIARILTTELGKLETDFLSWLEHNLSLFSANADLSDFDLGTLPVFRLARRLDFWLNELRFNQLRASENKEALSLIQMIERYYKDVCG